MGGFLIENQRLQNIKYFIWFLRFSGAHSTDSECNPSDLIRFYKTLQINLFPKQLGGLENDGEFLFFHNGGWGDPRDRALCMAM